MWFKELLKKSKKERVREKGIKKNKITIFLIPNKIYQVELLHIAKSVANKWDNIHYVCLNKPAEKVKEILRENKIDIKNFLFIAAVIKSKVSARDTNYISSPKNFKKFNSELNQILKKGKLECLIFDSLSTLLIYQNESTVIKFTHDLTTNLMIAHASGELICLAKDVNSALIKNITMFADEVIDISKGEIEQESLEGIGGLNKKEKIQKLEKELKSIRQAHAAELISEQSYLKAKERIGNNIRKLKNG